MSLLSQRKTNRAAFLFLSSIAVFLFLALPVPSSFQSHVSVIGPSVVWAGSPDETLNPPPTPPKGSARWLISTGNTTSATGRIFTGRTTLSSRTLISVLWRVYWATVRL